MLEMKEYPNVVIWSVYNVIIIKITGGEPFVRKDIFYALANRGDKKAFSLTTNFARNIIKMRNIENSNTKIFVSTLLGKHNLNNIREIYNKKFIPYLVLKFYYKNKICSYQNVPWNA